MKVIAGTGRCGTRWLTRTLSASGLTAGHETAHTADVVLDVPELDVDVSWLALTHGVTPDLIVGREPAGCIASLIDCGLFTDGDRFTVAVSRVIDLTGDPFTDACTWWSWVNSRPAPRWRLDQPGRLEDALYGVGLNVDVARVDPDPHPIGERRTRVKWDDLPPDVRAVAADWGWS